MKRSSNAAKPVESKSDVPESTPSAEVSQRIECLPVAKIGESKSNPRKSFGDMTELIDSVRTKGVLVTVLCRPAEDDGSWYLAHAGSGPRRQPAWRRSRRWSAR
jgi:hypothetical protein